MARLDKTLQNYQKQLKEKGIENIPDFIQSILDSDITQGKYSRFLLDCFIQDKFREEDLKGGLESTVGIAINLFHKHKSKLPEEQRSIYKYDSPGGLWNAVKQFDGVLSGKELKRSEQEQIYAETEFLYEDKQTGLKIVSPLTEDAAKWWGKGTRWCTSAEKNNQFKNYAKNAPLLIFLMPGGEKLQLWKNGNDIQFMDEADINICSQYFNQIWSILKDFMMTYENFTLFPLFPKASKTMEVCNKAIFHNGLNLAFVPEECKTEELCKLAIQNNGNVLEFVPEKYKTEEICQKSVEQNGLMIKFVPKHIRTEKIRELAINDNIQSLKFLEKQEFSENLKNLCISKYIYCNRYIVFNMDDNFYKKYIEQYPMMFYEIPEKMQTETMFRKYVFHNVNNFTNDKVSRKWLHVSKEYIDFCEKNNICMSLKNVTDMGYETLSKNFLASRLIELYYNFEDLKNCDVITNELVLKYILKYPSKLESIPKEYKTRDNIKIYLQHHGAFLSLIPEKLRDLELCQIAYQSNPLSLQYIPEHLNNDIMNDYTI